MNRPILKWSSHGRTLVVLLLIVNNVKVRTRARSVKSAAIIKTIEWQVGSQNSFFDDSNTPNTL